MPRGASIAFVRRREAVLRHQRRRQTGARRGAGMERLGHRAELLAHADRLRSRDAERHRRALDVERQEARARGGRAEHAGRAGDVPAAVVVVGIDHVADAARDVDAEHERVDELAARSIPMCSASASAADATGPAGWMIVLRCVSSKSKVCDEMPLRSAALAMSTRSARPSTVACGEGASSCTAASAAASVGWRAAPIAQPSQFMNVRCASRSTRGGKRRGRMVRRRTRRGCA